jgi:tetratricopeptide (TPR) repeat protein
MADRLEDLLRACTVRVLGGPMPGAGFFVAPGRVVTCVHVVGDIEKLVVRWERDNLPPVELPVTERIAVLRNQGRPIPDLDQDYPDIALLAVDDPGGHPCVAVDLEWPSQEDIFQVFGYPREGGAILLTPARLTYRGTHGTQPTVFMDLASDTIKPGMSGAAVLNLRPGAVCGIIVASKHIALPDGALVIPWSAVAAELAETLAQNRLYHAVDPRWTSAAAAYRERLRFRLPRTVPHFTGRDNLLRELDKGLNAQHVGVVTQALSGFGGVGKTQLAAAYVEAREHAFDIVAWIRAEDGGTRDLADLAVALGLPVVERTPEERAADVMVYLSNVDRNWLLVLDNASGPEALIDIPRSGTGRVLVTSRHRGGYEAFGPELPIDVFDEDAAVRYLLARSGRDDEQAARAVAAALGRLPLALGHAAAYCTTGSGITFGDYLELVEGLPAQELFDTNREVFYYQTVAVTWNTSIGAAEKCAPAARAALNMTAYLAPEGLPRSFFAALTEDSALGRKRVNDALAALHRYSLVTVTESSVSIHRLLQKVLRDRMEEPSVAQAFSDALSALSRARPGDPRLPEMWPKWQELVPHVETLAKYGIPGPDQAEELVSVLNDTCTFLVASGSPRRALALSRRAVIVASQRLGADHPQTLAAKRILALSCESAGLHAEAISQGEQVVADCERVLGADDPDTLWARSNLARSYESARRSRQAVAAGERLVADCVRVLGPDNPQTLTAMDNLAASYMAAGRIPDAIAIGEKLVADSERILGPDHPETLMARDNLAISYRSAGRIIEGIAIGEKLVADRERILGDQHPATLDARYSLASAYRSAGRIAEAIATEEQVVTDRERILGPDHPDSLWARGNLGLSYESAGRTADAVALDEQVVADCERILGPDDPHTLTARANLAISYRSAGRLDIAISMQEKLIADRERIIGTDHPATLSGRDHLAISYRLSGRTEDAIRVAEQLAADRERVLGPRHPATLVGRDNLAVCYRSAGRPDDAVRLSGQLVPLFEQVLGPDHPDTLWARQGLADSCRAAGQIDQAIVLGKQLVADSERILGPDHPYTRRVRRSLADSYHAAGRDQDAAALAAAPAADCERILWE